MGSCHARIDCVSGLDFRAFPGQPTDAATAGEPAYRTAILGQNSPLAEGLLLEFAPDERQCQARYGRQWQEKCATSLGRSGDTVTSVKLFASSAGPLAVARWHKPCLLPEEGHSLSPEYNLQRKSGKSLQAGFTTIIDRKKSRLQQCRLPFA